ncbi:hypothetical protein V8F33_003625 [Rhypophila sp. PSN 637]
MGSNDAKGEKEKLPIPPDINQIFNRISMGISHHNLLSSTLKRKSTTSSTTAPDSASSSNTKKGFSSLAGNSTQNPTTTKPAVDDKMNVNQRSRERSITRLADLDAEFEIYGGPPNGGVGYQPEKTSLQGSLTGNDRKLGAQILGRKGGGREDKFVANSKNKRHVNESESEDDVGRSAVGRVKKKFKSNYPTTGVPTATAAVATPKGDDDDDAVQDNVNMGSVQGEGEKVQQDKSQAGLVGSDEIAAEKTSSPAGIEPTGELEEARPQDGEADEQDKKKKKKKKSNKNRIKKKTNKQRGAADEGEGGAANGGEQQQEKGQDEDEEE